MIILIVLSIVNISSFIIALANKPVTDKFGLHFVGEKKQCPITINKSQNCTKDRDCTCIQCDGSGFIGTMCIGGLFVPPCMDKESLKTDSPQKCTSDNSDDCVCYL